MRRENGPVYSPLYQSKEVGSFFTALTMFVQVRQTILTQPAKGGKKAMEWPASARKSQFFSLTREVFALVHPILPVYPPNEADAFCEEN